jgi:hypothetical protein
VSIDPPIHPSTWPGGAPMAIAVGPVRLSRARVAIIVLLLLFALTMFLHSSPSAPAAGALSSSRGSGRLARIVEDDDTESHFQTEATSATAAMPTSAGLSVDDPRAARRRRVLSEPDNDDGVCLPCPGCPACPQCPVCPLPKDCPPCPCKR